MTKLRALIDSLTRNVRLTQWPATVFDPFNEADAIVEKFHAEKAAIDVDRHLTPEGKSAARVKAGKAAIDAIAKWHAPKIAGLDADLGVHRTALLPTGEKPDGKKVDYMLSQLQKHTAQEIATFYNSATDAERLVMEAASVGRIPTKTVQGLEWQPLLNPETVNDSIAARATARNPQGAQKLTELTEIRAMHVTVHGHAVAEIVAEVPGAAPAPELAIYQ